MGSHSHFFLNNKEEEKELTLAGSRPTRPQARAATPGQPWEIATIPMESGPGYKNINWKDKHLHHKIIKERRKQIEHENLEEKKKRVERGKM